MLSRLNQTNPMQKKFAGSVCPPTDTGAGDQGGAPAEFAVVERLTVAVEKMLARWSSDTGESLLKGLTATRSRLPPDVTKPDRSGLTGTADARGSARSIVVSAHPPGSWNQRSETGPSPASSMNRVGGKRGARAESDWARLGTVIEVKYERYDGSQLPAIRTRTCDQRARA